LNGAEQKSIASINSAENAAERPRSVRHRITLIHRPIYLTKDVARWPRRTLTCRDYTARSKDPAIDCTRLNARVIDLPLYELKRDSPLPFLEEAAKLTPKCLAPADAVVIGGRRLKWRPLHPKSFKEAFEKVRMRLDRLDIQSSTGRQEHPYVLGHASARMSRLTTNVTIATRSDPMCSTRNSATGPTRKKDNYRAEHGAWNGPAPMNLTGPTAAPIWV